jgi:hypothetical protein
MASIPRIAVLLPLLSAACATTSTGRLDLDCNNGEAGACSAWGSQMLDQGEKQQAENAFARSCEAGVVSDCVSQGKLMIERGELAGAEPPLVRAYEAEELDATLALADLHQARANPGDAELAEQLRWEALAIDKPARETIFWVRPSPTERTSYAFAYYFQPMEFWARRMNLGLHTTWNSQGVDELNVAVGYQHFLTPEIVPYATLLMGGTLQKHGFNVGGEAGVKFCLGPIGHLNLGAGSSVASPFHASVGIGLNSLPFDILLLIAAHAH